MKNSTLTIFAAGALLLGLSNCSSSNPETTTTPPAEEVTTDQSTAKTNIEATSPNTSRTGSDSVAAFTDTTSFQAVATSINIVEVLAGVQAKSKARNAEVKKFADQMVTAHTKSGDDLKRIAGMRNFNLPNTSLYGHQRMINKVTNEKDLDEFDKEYMDMQVQIHSQAVELYEKAAKNQQDPDLLAFASENLPTVRMHLDNAKKLKSMLK
jgi:putative membrane protein